MSTVIDKRNLVWLTVILEQDIVCLGRRGLWPRLEQNRDQDQEHSRLKAPPTFPQTF